MELTVSNDEQVAFTVKNGEATQGIMGTEMWI
jgi:hypothetical protein